MLARSHEATRPEGEVGAEKSAGVPAQKVRFWPPSARGRTPRRSRSISARSPCPCSRCFSS
eukprot:3549824-Pyramimonas_sp.AAC.1